MFILWTALARQIFVLYNIFVFIILYNSNKLMGNKCVDINLHHDNNWKEWFHRNFPSEIQF